MGLDQYAHTITKRGQDLRKELLKLSTDEERKAFHKETRLEDEVHQFSYWRKHANLNEWMTKLAVKKGVVGQPIEFNCVDLVLEVEDINNLEMEIACLPEGAGFFWGQSRPEDTETDLQFIAKARKAFARGDQVIYSCWW